MSQRVKSEIGDLKFATYSPESNTHLTRCEVAENPIRDAGFRRRGRCFGYVVSFSPRLN